MNYPLVAKLLGVVMLILSLAFLSCLGISYRLDSPAAAAPSRQAFVAATAAALAAAGLFLWVGRRHTKKFYRKEALCTIGLSWLLSSLMGSIPYLVVVPEAGFSGAFFESASGLTTTGASVLSDLESLPPSLLFWRSLSQWIGGMGVVVFFVAVLGFIGVGAKMLYANEASGVVSEFEESRIQSTVLRLVWTYLGLSTLCGLAYWAAGMGPFDAINHTFTTLSTGGFSTRSDSMADFQSPAIEWICIVSMTLGGTSFLLIIHALRGRPRPLLKNTELKTYIAILLASSAIIAFALFLDREAPSVHQAIRDAAFQTVSIMTTTGYATRDYADWSSLAQIILVLLMIVGGSTGSTSGGIKVSRLVVAFKLSLLSVERSFRSRVVRQIRINDNALSPSAVNEAVNYLILAISVVLASILAIALLEPRLQIDTNVSAIFACFFNIGPGLAEVGPTENFALFRPHTKVFLALLMIMGRLELYAILALLSPSLWKRFA